MLVYGSLPGLPSVVTALGEQHSALMRQPDDAVVIRNEQGLMKHWLGSGEMLIAIWPSDCRPERFGDKWEITSFAKLQNEFAAKGGNFWMRGKTKRKADETGKKLAGYKVNLIGPEGSVLSQYTYLRDIMAKKRGSYKGLPPPRKVMLLDVLPEGLHLSDKSPKTQGTESQTSRSSAAGADRQEEQGGEEVISDDEEFQADGDTPEAFNHKLPTGNMEDLEDQQLGEMFVPLLQPDQFPVEANLERGFYEMIQKAETALEVAEHMVACAWTLRSCRVRWFRRTGEVAILSLCCGSDGSISSSRKSCGPLFS